MDCRFRLDYDPNFDFDYPNMDRLDWIGLASPGPLREIRGPEVGENAGA